MQTSHEQQLPRLGIGRVKWFGGTNKSGKEQHFGFITDGSEHDLFAHVSKLDCSATDIQEGAHVVFEEHKTKKGREAHSVRPLEAENDLSVLEALLRSNYIQLEFRTRVLVRYSDPIGVGITKLLVGTVQEVLQSGLDILNGLDIQVSDSDRSRLSLEWPQSWLDCELDGDVFNVMPFDFKENACKKHYSAFLEILQKLSSFEITSIEARKIYNELNSSDFQLAEKWCSKDTDYERARMISARGAELASKYFYEQAGDTVLDTALQQILDGDDWLTHDLRLNNRIPIDVKNARQGINASVLVELTVPKFKQDRNSAEVRICGILSPYAKFDDIKRGTVEGDILFLGETSLSEIDSLISLFNKPGHFELEQRLLEKLPVWLFNIPSSIDESGRSTATSNDRHNCPAARHWSYLPSSMLPCCVAAGIDLPEQIEQKLPKWERLFIASLRDVGPPSLGKVYLAILSHFCHALKNMARAEQASFDPTRYWELLYLSKPTELSLGVRLINRYRG